MRQAWSMRQMGHFQWCPWWRLGRWRWWWWWMRAEGNLEASRYVPCAPAVVEQKGFACPLLVAMPSIATFLIDPLASAHSHPRPVIALDAIFSPLPYYSLIIVIIGKKNWGLSLVNYVASVNGKWRLKNICSWLVIIIIWELLFSGFFFSAVLTGIC